MKKVKKLASLLLAMLMTMNVVLPVAAADSPTSAEVLQESEQLEESAQPEEQPELLFEENFEGAETDERLTLNGSAKVENGVLVLDGSAGTYAEIKGSLLAGKDSLTISMDLTTQMTNQWCFTAAIGQSTTNYAFLRFREKEVAFHITESGNGGEDTADYTVSESMIGAKKNVVMTIEPGKIALFVDGKPVAQAQTDVTLADLGGGDAQILLGKSFYDDPLFQGTYDNIKIYDGVLSAQAIAEANGLDWDEVLEELSAPVRALAEPELKYLTLTTDEHPTSSELYYQQKIQNPVTDDIVLWDISHSKKYSITWESSHPEILSNTGELLQIPEKDTYVTLTATVHVPGVDYLPDPSAAQKELSVLVPCLETRRQMDADALTIMNPDDVRDMLPLVAEGDNGSKIDWTSSNPDVITDTPASESDLYGGGVVTRPKAGEDSVEVKLTATITLDGVEGALTRSWDVTVTPETEQDTEYDKYLFVYYGENYDWDQDGITQEEIYFGVSEDGFVWNNLNVKTREDGSVYTKSMLQSTVGDQGVRDVHIVRSPDGDKYYIMATDLRAVGTGPANKEESGWDGRMDVQNGSQSLVIWESNDLIHWSEPRLVKVNFDTAGHTWAPEAIWDPEANAYLVYWSSTDTAKDDYIRVYCCYTRDFQTFSEPEIFVDTSDNVNTGWTGPYSSIDTTIAKEGDTYYRITKNNFNGTCYYETNKSLQGPWEWGSVIQGTGTAEGPTHYQLPDGRWVLLVDNYSTYVPFVGNSLADLSKVVGTEGGFQRADINFPENSANYKHGTILAISDAEYERLLEEYGVATVDLPEADADGKVYVENFEGDELTQEMTLHGNAAVQADTDDNHALYLDGSSSSYAELPVGWFDGLDNFTISMDVKPEIDSGYSMTFATGTGIKRRLYTRVNGTEVVAQISNNDNEGAKTAQYTPASSITGEWVKFTLVMDGDSKTMTIYLDGKEVAKTDLTTTMSDLGVGLQTYLGKSFYSADPGYQGWIDNVQLWNRALDAEEVANLSEEEVVNQYTVTVETDGNGTASAEPARAAAGTEITLNATANDGYHFKEWQVVNGDVTIENNQFTMPKGNVTVKAVFEQNVVEPTEYTVTVETDGNGTASATPARAAADTEITLSATANDGYHFKEWQVVAGGVTIENNQFTMPESNVTVKAVFEKESSGGSTGGGGSSVSSYTITVQQAEGGKITPGTTTVTRGGSKTFTITPDADHEITDVLVDGKSVGAVSTYTFKDVKASHTITAKFGTDIDDDDTPLGDLPFTDVKAGDWFAEAVQYVTDRKLFNGTSENTFSPNAEMTRAMFVTVLARLEGVDTATGDTWYEAGREWAMENGISDGTNMTGHLTREQLATMLYRYVGEPAVSGSITGFSDTASVSDWAEDAMTWAVQNGIISGSNGKLNPQNNATRAEVATMLMRFCQL